MLLAPAGAECGARAAWAAARAAARRARAPHAVCSAKLLLAARRHWSAAEELTRAAKFSTARRTVPRAADQVPNNALELRVFYALLRLDSFELLHLAQLVAHLRQLAHLGAVHRAHALASRLPVAGEREGGETRKVR